MTHKFKYRRVSLMVLAVTLPLLTGCIESNFQPYDGPVTVAPPPPPPPPPPGGVAAGTVLAVNALEKGQCADTGSNEVLIDNVTIRDCNGSHEFEVAGTITRPEIAGLDFPGRIDLVSNAQLDCEAPFEQQVGTAYFDSATAIDLDTITPSVSTWADGDRTVICLIVGKDGALLDKPASEY